MKNNDDLNCWTKEEWSDVVFQLQPGLSQEEYDKMWDEFQDAKRQHEESKAIM